jgi:type III secretion system (T3SS) SseB-like protein
VTSTVDNAENPLVPPMLYLPVADCADGRDELSIDFRRMRDGRTALVAYTALDRLVDGCGPAQPWVLLPTADLTAIEERSPYDVILLDVAIPDHMRRTAGGV